MNDCYFAKKDWRLCKDEVRHAETACKRTQKPHHTCSSLDFTSPYTMNQRIEADEYVPADGGISRVLEAQGQ
jgi:hypothetical protein